MAEITKEMARFLKLPNPESYTSHSIRRTGATLLAEQGITTEALRQYGGWKNASTAQVYIGSTVSNKKRLAEAVLDSPTATKKPFVPTPAVALQPTTPSPYSSIPPQFLNNGNFENCTFHIHNQ
jgi:hypothetical protein